MKSKAVTLCSIIADAQDCLPRFFSWCLPRFENIIIVASESIDNTHAMLQTVSDNNQNVVLAYREMDNFACQKQYCDQFFKYSYSNSQFRLFNSNVSFYNQSLL